MSLYITVYLLLLFSMLLAEILKKRIYIIGVCKSSLDSIVYYLVFTTIFFMLVLRYGQGTDYFGYYRTFNFLMPDLIFERWVHTEFGWNILNVSVKLAGLSFEFLVFIISTIEMLCIKKFIDNYCSSFKIMALAILYPAVILVYLFSALRQGFIISIFLGYMLPLLDKEEYKKYIIITLLMMTIHTVATFYLLLVPIRKKDNRINVVKMDIIKLACSMIALFWGVVNPARIFFSFIPLEILSRAGVEFSYNAVIENIVISSLMTCLYYNSSNREELRKYYILFSYGAIFFFLMSWMTLLANRAFSCWKYVYVVFFVKYFTSNRCIKRQLATIFFICFSFFMTLRNINAIILQGRYRSNVSIFNFPYISIFDKSIIYRIRNVSGSISEFP